MGISRKPDVANGPSQHGCFAGPRVLRRLTTTGVLFSALLGLLAIAPSASARFQSVHRSSAVNNPSQVNYFTEMAIADVGVGNPSSGSFNNQSVAPQDGLGDVLGLSLIHI